jgi:hypothetical protein
MSTNWISCRRVKFQEIDKRGRAIRKPSCGVLVADYYVQGYNDSFESLEDLNEAIAEEDMIALLEDVNCDFDVDSDDPRWKDNYAGIKYDEDEGESP